MKTNAMRTWLGIVVGLALLAADAASPVQAQSAFATAAEVGNRIVTNYEVTQRARLMEAIGDGANPADEALNLLIEERLKAIAAETAGVTITDSELQRGLADFAARGDLSTDQFIAQIEQAGVDASTFRDFVSVGLVWRKLIQQRFGARTNVTDAELDRELGLTGQQGTVEVQFSEIFLPVNTENNRAITEELTPQILALTRFAPFEDAARRFSVGPSRENGGRVDRWVSVTNLPPKLREVVLTLSPGQVTGPIDFPPNAIGLFQLRATRESTVSRSGSGPIDYATYAVQGGTPQELTANAQAVLDRTDTCDDLYGLAKGLEPNPLTRVQLPLPQIANDVALALSRLDPGEAQLVGNLDAGSASIVMLCARLPASATGTDQEELRDNLRRTLTNRKLEAYSDALLQELRAETRIVIR